MVSVVDASIELAGSLALPAPGPSALSLPHGLHEGISEEQYHRKVFGIASKHMLDLFDESALTYRTYIEYGVDEDAEEKEHQLIGAAVDCAMLEPERFVTAYAVEPDFGYLMKNDASGTTKEQGAENRKRRDAWRAEHIGAKLLKPEQYRDVAGMAESMRSHPRIAALLESGAKSQVTARWVDPETGLECKARWDLWFAAFGVIFDLKTTRDARIESFSRDVERYGYHDQAAMYLEAADALGIETGPFLLGAVKKVHPYLRAVYGLDEGALMRGHRRIRRRMRLMARCIERDEWPGLPTEIQTIELPKWARD